MKTDLKLFILICSVSFLIFSENSSGAAKPKSSKSLSTTNYELFWSDEFNYNCLPNSEKWSYDTKGNFFNRW